MRVAVVGRRGLGGVKMRGLPVAEALGVPYLSPEEAEQQRWDLIYLVKYPHDADRLREATRVLIWDPLDVWEGWRQGHMSPPDFWARAFVRVRPDAVIATSPSCVSQMHNGIYSIKKGHGVDEITLFLVPHQSDPRVKPEWRDPKGPATYVGAKRFIGSFASILRHRKYRLDFSRDPVPSLKGASCALVGRWECDTSLNLTCKPGVKIANGAVLGRVLARPDSVFLSLVGEWCDRFEAFDDRDLGPLIVAERAMCSGVSPYGLKDYVQAINTIIGRF